MEAAKNLISSAEIDNDTTRTKRRYTVNNNSYLTPDLIDSAIYNDDMLEEILSGIAQNIWIEMDKQGMTIRGLSELSTVNYSQLTKAFNNKAHIGLTSLIKLATALHMTPAQLFPFDQNKRKTTGQKIDDMIKDWSIQGENFLLDMVADMNKLGSFKR